MAAVTITLGGVNVTPLVLFPSAIFDSQVNGKPGTCKFRIRDESGTATYIPGSDLLLEIDGDPVWAGYATVISRVYVFPALDLGAFGTTRFFDVIGVDLNIFFQRRIVFNQADPEDIYGTLFPVGTPDTTAITDLLANFLDLSGDSLDTTSGVENVGDITIDQEGRAWQGSDRWGDAMTSIARIPGAIFYIDPSRVFRYVDDDAADAPFGLSDIAGFTFGDLAFKTYREMEILVDGTGLANDVLGWGAGYGSDEPVFIRVIDTDSVTAHGLWQDSKVYFGTFKQDTLDANVNSIVYGSPTNLRGAKDDKLAVTLTTFASGFQPAQKVMFFSEIFGWNEVLPIRKMTIRFPAPDTPKYELVLSHEIDTPYDIIDNLLFDNRLPPIPPILPPIHDPPNPPPPPPAPISCGITDAYNRATTDYSENALGQADCGRFYESGSQAIQGNRAEAYGALNVDAESNPGGGDDWTMPGPWPVPFGGGIVLADADNFPGFTAVTDPDQAYPTGWAWRTSPGGYLGFSKSYFDGTRAVIPPFNSITTDTGGTGGGAPFVSSPSLVIAGHFQLVETADAHGLALDDYIKVGMGIRTQSTASGGDTHSIGVSIYPIGTPGDGRTELDWPAFNPSEGACEFPPFFWQSNGGSADFTIEYITVAHEWQEEPYSAIVVVTVGPCSVVRHILPSQLLAPSYFAIGNGSAWEDDPEGTYATMYVDDPVTFDTGGGPLTIDNPREWVWRIGGGLSTDGHSMEYEFAYTGYGAQWPGFPSQFDTGIVPFGETWPYSPGLVGPYIAAKIIDTTAGSYSVAWTTVSPLSLPAIPHVSIDSFGARLTIGGVSVTALAANAIDYQTGEPAPMGLLSELQGDLTQFVGADQGTYFAYDDLNITGVNACTEGFINQTGNWLSVSFVGDGTTDTFTLPGPFLRGTAAVYVDGFRQRQVVDYIEGPEAGTIIFATAPAAGALIVVSYYPVAPAGTDPPVPPPPPPPPPPGGEYIAPPTTTATYFLSDTSIDFSGVTDVTADLINFVAACPSGSIIDFDVPGGIYRMASGGLLFEQLSQLDVFGHGWTTLRITGDGDDEYRSAFLMRASDHIRIRGFIVRADGVSITASEGERAHGLGISGFFALGPSSYIEMTGCDISHVKGDGVYIEGSNGGSYPPSHHVWVHDNDFDYMGRNWVSFINCTDVMVESNTANHISYHAVDYEANFAAEEITNTTVRFNSIGSYAHRVNLLGFFVADVSLGWAVTSGALIHGNIVAGIASAGYPGGGSRGLDSKFLGDGYPPDGVTRHDNITFTANSTAQTRSGPVIYGYKIDTFVVTGNHQPMSGGSFVQAVDCTDTTLSPNP